MAYTLKVIELFGLSAVYLAKADNCYSSVGKKGTISILL